MIHARLLIAIGAAISKKIFKGKILSSKLNSQKV